MGIWNDLRYSARALRREPAFAVVAILTVALGIGANTAIFSMVNGVLLRGLPFPEPERLIALREIMPAFEQTYPSLPASARHFVEWRQRARSFERLSAIDPGTATLTDGAPEQLDIMRVSADMFRTLGVQASLGRTFVDGEDEEVKEGVAVISYALWQRRFNADPAIVGRTIHLDSRPRTVIGVLPASFLCPSLRVMEVGKSNPARPDVFVPLSLTKDELSVLMGRFNYNVIARLKPGVTPAAATAELNVVAGQLVKLSGEPVDLRGWAVPLLDSMVGHTRRGLIVLLGAVGAVLLIVCVNLANLMLARGERQMRESAIRTALGAGTGRLVRQALTQSLLIAFMGGTFGVLIAAGSLGALVKSAPADIPRLDEVRLDARVLVFALAITTLTGVLFGLAPAWRAGRVNLQTAIKTVAGRSATTAASGLRLRNTLVVAEVGLSTVLLVTAALLMTSFIRVMRAEKGFSAPTVLAADVQIPTARYGEDAQRDRFYRRLVAQLAAQPGVASAAVVSALPLQGEIWIDNVSVPGDTRSGWQQPTANVRFISPDYFRTMGIPLRSGRPFTDADQRHVAIVSEGLARILWPGQNPIGRQITDGDKAREVIAVAGDVRAEADKPPVAMIYRPYWDWSPRNVILVARAAGDPRSIAGALRSAVSSIDSEVPLAQIRTMQEVLDESVAQRRFQMWLAGAFAATALLLATLGIYGVVSYTVTRRTNELGIRMALGAQAHQLYTMVVRQAMRPVAIGLVVGLAGAWAVGRLVSGLLYQVNPRDPELLAITAVLLIATGLTAASLPARRAMRMSPMNALRDE
jgi:predicted permease